MNSSVVLAGLFKLWSYSIIACKYNLIWAQLHPCVFHVVLLYSHRWHCCLHNQKLKLTWDNQWNIWPSGSGAFLTILIQFNILKHFLLLTCWCCGHWLGLRGLGQFWVELACFPCVCVCVCVLSGYSGFLPHSKDLHVRWIGNFKLSVWDSVNISSTVFAARRWSVHFCRM